MKITPVAAVVFICGLGVISAGCSSGGGGGDSGPAGRTRDTAVRVIHGSIDAAPVTIKVGETSQQRASFLEPTSYLSVDRGPQSVTISGGRSPEQAISSFPYDFQDNTEYSLLVFGEAALGSFNTLMIAEPISQPAVTRAFLKVADAYSGSSSIKVGVAGVATQTVAIGAMTQPIDLPAGPVEVVISNSSGQELQRVPLVLTAQGETLLVVAGAKDLGAVVTRTYEDLD